MKFHFPSLCSIQVEEVEWPQLNSRQRKLLGVLSSVGETSDNELEGGGGRDLGSYDLSDDGFLSFFTRCKSSSLLIEKISLNLGKQGWRLRSETDNSEYVHMKIVTRSNNHIERFNVLRVQSFSWFLYLDLIFLLHKTGIIMYHSWSRILSKNSE